MSDFGQKIKNLRLSHGMTQQDIAEKMGVARNTVSQWESGERKMSADQLIKYAKISRVTLDYFNDQPADANLFDLLNRLSDFFRAHNIPEQDKDKAYQDIMRLYLQSKDVANTAKHTVEGKTNDNKINPL